MKRALQRYGFHFAAVLGVVVVGLVCATYILSNQRFYLPKWVPILGADFVDYTADFKTAKAVVPGQGQTVAISGVTVGEIGAVNIVNGRGRVTMKIRREYAGRIHTDATAALRARTPLQDMIIQLDPGTKSAPVMKAGGNIPAARTMTPTEFDDIISEFDGDTRQYLAILLQQGAKGLGDEGGKYLGDVLRGVEPATVYSARIAKALKSRQEQAARAVTNLEKVSNALSQNDEALGTVISDGSEAFQAIAETRDDLGELIQNSPEALRKTQELLETGGSIGTDLAKAAQTLDRPTRKLDDGLAKLVKFMNDSTPVIRNDLRPFARDVQEPLGVLKPAVDDIAASAKNVGTGTTVLRQLFDGLAYEPDGEDLSALTLAGYLGHAGMSLTSAQDASGAVTRALIYTNCGLTGSSRTVRGNSPATRLLLDFLGTPTEKTPLPNGQTGEQYCATAGK